MTTAGPGITFRETMSGPFALGATTPEEGKRLGEEAGARLAMHADVTIDDVSRFADDPSHEGAIAGRIDFAPIGIGIPATRGRFNLFSPTGRPGMKHMVYELGFEAGGRDYYLAGHKEVHADPGFDLWSDTTTLHTTLHEGTDADAPVVGAGVLTLGPADLASLVSTARVTGAGSPAAAAATLARFGAFFMGELWDTYAATPRAWWRRLLDWLLRRG